jgi:hypothetical protein
MHPSNADSCWNQITGSTVIVDDVITYARNIHVLLAYFKAMLMTLECHQVAVKLRKCRFLPSRTEFAGMDLSEEESHQHSSVGELATG